MATFNNRGNHPPEPPQGPIGDRVREILNPALADERRKQYQLDILNHYFEEATKQLPQIMEKSFRSIFNKVTRAEQDQKNLVVIDQLTNVDPQSGRALFSPAMAIPISICVDYADFTAEDVRTLPGYIQLHEMAREQNIAVRISGLLTDDKREGQPPILILDTSKTYEMGATEDSGMYPNLPPEKEKSAASSQAANNNARTAKRYHFGS